jgi:hypothetical protein
MNVTGILNSFKRFFKRRQYQRYYVKEGTLVVISPDNAKNLEQKVELIDISRGGMAFIYKGSPSDIAASGLIKLLTKNQPYSKEGIPFGTVSDIPISGKIQKSEQFRRRGVKFKWLGFYDEFALMYFINEVTICEK